MDEMKTLSVENHSPRVSGPFLVLGIILVAANLRASITGLGPLIAIICQETGLSSAIAGMLTTLPLLAFAILSPLAPILARRMGIERTLGVSLAVLTAGIVVRYAFWNVGLFLGMFLAGAGIAMGNVLLPSLIKRDFPQHVGLMTGVYSVSMGVVAAVASGVSVPLSRISGVGWKGSMASWAILSLVALVVWIPQWKVHHVPRNNHSTIRLWQSSLAWQVTLFMGLQSFIFYVNIAWLPDVLQSRGMTATSAGWMLSLMQFVSLPASFIVPILAGRKRSQRALVVFIVVLFIIGYIGLIGAPKSLDWLWISLIGVAAGGSISLALTFFGLRSHSSHDAAKLSGMAQSLGYLLAAIGPLLIGVVHDAAHSWSVPLLILVVATVLLFLVGLGAGRDIYINSESPKGDWGVGME